MANVAFEIILDMQPERFQQIERDFLTEVSEVMKIHASDLWIVDIHEGCTILVLLGPEEEVELFLAEMNSSSKSPATLKLKRSRKIRRAYRSGSIESPAIHTAKRVRQISLNQDPEDSHPTFTWVHLSDVHLRAGENGDVFTQDLVTKKFLTDLPILLDDQRLQPEIVFFTGDIVFSGKVAEYQSAFSFFEAVLKTFKRRPRLMFIPGNHDVTWSMIKKADDVRLRGELNSDLAVSRHLIDDATSLDRQVGLLRLQNYFEFSDRCEAFGQPKRDHGLFYTTEFMHRGLKVGVCGLNSAWRCTRKDDLPKNELTTDPDLGHLLLGKAQLVKAADAVKNCDVRIALMHHPAMDAWFRDFDKQSQANYLAEFDYVLRGHEHVFTGSVLARLGDTREITQLAAGALYQSDPWPKLFSATVIDLKDRMQTIFKWKYDSDDERWHVITEPASKQPGYRGRLPAQLDRRLAVSVGATQG
jgi:hypothetical protein